MTDVINLNSIRSDNCDCNKPKQTSCGCSNHNTQPCQQTVNLSDLYFKVKNLFGELKSEWQREEARLNLGVTDIIDLRLIKFGEGSGDTNIWEMITSKGGSQKIYDFVVKNGEKGESATIEISGVNMLPYGSTPTAVNNGTKNNAIYVLNIPSGPKGEPGTNGVDGESAFAIANKVRRALHLDPFETELEWLESLKGKDGTSEKTITNISLLGYRYETKEVPNSTPVTGNMYIWEVKWSDGTSSLIWVPEMSTEQKQEQVIPLFLYKKHYFLYGYPTDSELNAELNKLRTEVNQSLTAGKSVEVLTSEAYNWKDYALTIDNQGQDFIYMAITTKVGDRINPWQVVQLTGARGNNGADGADGKDGKDGKDGVDGQDCDCSGSTPSLPDTPDTPDTPGQAYGCRITVNIQDYYEETELHPSGILVPLLRITVRTYNNTDSAKRLYMHPRNLDVMYKPDSSSLPLKAYSLILPGIYFTVPANTSSDSESAYLPTANKKFVDIMGGTFEIEYDDLAGFTRTSVLDSIVDSGEETLASGVTLQGDTIIYNLFDVIAQQQQISM